MIRAARLAVSRPMYAFDPDSLDDRTVRAVWFKRKHGVLNAVMGSYHFFHLDRSVPEPTTYEGWVALHADNRYGGTHHASWDGARLLGDGQPATPDTVARQREFLAAMLGRYPEPPAGYDGWWTFERSSR